MGSSVCSAQNILDHDSRIGNAIDIANTGLTTGLHHSSCWRGYKPASQIGFGLAQRLQLLNY
jgi:hypothetical protein